MGKPTICIGENKDADQLRGNREADQRLCFRYLDSIIPLLLKAEISSFYPFSVLVQAGLYRTCSETTLLGFPRGGSFDFSCRAKHFNIFLVHFKYMHNFSILRNILFIQTIFVYYFLEVMISLLLFLCFVKFLLLCY